MDIKIPDGYVLVPREIYGLLIRMSVAANPPQHTADPGKILVGRTGDPIPPIFQTT